MDTTDMRFEHLGADHTVALRDLYRTVFQKEVGKDYFVAKYGLDNPTRIQYSTIALHKGKVIGFFGCMGQEFKDHRRESVVQLGSVCDFILLEQYRGKKIFDLLYLHTLERVQEQGIQCMFGFQSDQTFKFCERMGWKEGRSFDRFSISIRNKKITKIIAKMRGEEKMKDRVMKSLKPYLIKDELDQLNRISDFFTRVYNDSFYEEKGDRNQRVLVQIGGIIMCVKYQNDLIAGLVRITENIDITIFKQGIDRILKSAGIGGLTIHLQRHSPEHTVFSSFLDPQKSFKISYIRTREDGCQIDDLALNFIDMDIF